MAIVITHIDMIPAMYRYQFIGEVRTAMQKERVSSNYIHFGRKECEWDEEDLQGLVHQSLPEVMYPEIDQNLCKKEGCTHQFTDDTRMEYLSLLKKFQFVVERNL